MIKEFAIDPEVMGTWNYFQVLWDDFGLAKARMISEFPGKWRKMVYAAAAEKSPTIKAHTIRSRISHEYASRMWSSGREYPQDGASWLSRALVAHQAVPFHAIVTSRQVDGEDRVLDVEILNRAEEPYYVKTQLEDVPRTAEGIANAMATLLKTCRRLFLADPYFRPGEDNYARVICELLMRTDPEVLQSVEIHTLVSGAINMKAQAQHVDRFLVPYLPKSCGLSVCFWGQRPNGKQFHSRKILLDGCGIQVDPGFEERLGDPGHVVELILMPDDRVQTVLTDFGAGGGAYDLVEGGRIERVGG